MAILDIVYYPDAPLTSKAEPFSEVELGNDLYALATNMVETMFTHDGVGLAGPQVGLSKRIFVLCEPDADPMCFINPEISELEGREEGEEGCLSMPKIYAMVPRATKLRIKALNESGESVDMVAENFLARIIQHEYDHLNGVMFPDRLDIITREHLLREWLEMREQLHEPSHLNIESRQ